MTELKPLLIRPPMLPDETLNSYLHRIAAANGHRSSIVETLALENLFWPDRVRMPQNPETLDVIAALTKLPHHKIFFASAHGLTHLLVPHDFAVDSMQFSPWMVLPKLPRKFMRRHLKPQTILQFCPRCLAEAGYQRRSWLLSSVSACIHHRCLLLDCCPSCGEGIKLTDIVSGACHNCRYHLPQAPTLDVSHDEAGLFAQGLLHSWICAGPHLKASIPRVPVRERYGVLHVLKE